MIIHCWLSNIFAYNYWKYAKKLLCYYCTFAVVSVLHIWVNIPKLCLPNDEYNIFLHVATFLKIVFPLIGKKWVSLIVSWFWLHVPLQSEAKLQSTAEWKCPTPNTNVYAFIYSDIRATWIFRSANVSGFINSSIDELTQVPSGSPGHALDKPWLLKSRRRTPLGTSGSAQWF